MDTQPAPPARVHVPRWFSVCLILAVFSLPLHFHAISPIASQVSKECICLHGSRTQANLTSTAVACAPLTIISALAPVTQAAFVSLPVGLPSSRAPPA
jgi:hypothetical protein